MRRESWSFRFRAFSSRRLRNARCALRFCSRRRFSGLSDLELRRMSCKDLPSAFRRLPSRLLPRGIFFGGDGGTWSCIPRNSIWVLSVLTADLRQAQKLGYIVIPLVVLSRVRMVFRECFAGSWSLDPAVLTNPSLYSPHFEELYWSSVQLSQNMKKIANVNHSCCAPSCPMSGNTKTVPPYLLALTVGCYRSEYKFRFVKFQCGSHKDLW